MSLFDENGNPTSSNPNDYTQAQLDALNPYGFWPSVAMAAIFLVLFISSFFLHIYQTIKAGKRFSWMHLMAVGCLLEILGWGARMWSRANILAGGYIMQLCCLTIGPTFFSAALYMLLGVLIKSIAPQRSYLSGKWFKIWFLIADIFSLVLQAIGGGLAATASTNAGSRMGGNIMLAGIIFQLVVMIVYVAYGGWWAFRSHQEIRLAGPKITQMGIGMIICSIAIIIRGFFRSAELGDGFSGPLAQNEPLFLLDAIPMAIATYAINVFHPSRLLQDLPTGDDTVTSGNSSLQLQEKNGGYGRAGEV